MKCLSVSTCNMETFLEYFCKPPGLGKVYTCIMQDCECVCVCNGVMCSHTRHQTSLWTRHLLATLETSSGPAAGPSLLFGSNPSHKYLWSCQNLRRKMKKEVGVATKHRSLCVGEEEATQSPSVPSPPPSLCPSTLRHRCLRHSLKIQTLIFQGPVEWVQLRATGDGSRHRINSTYLQSSQWSPQLPCSSWQPDLCGQICWHLGTTCRRRFPPPSGSSF